MGVDAARRSSGSGCYGSRPQKLVTDVKVVPAIAPFGPAAAWLDVDVMKMLLPSLHAANCHFSRM